MHKSLRRNYDIFGFEWIIRKYEKCVHVYVTISMYIWYKIPASHTGRWRDLGLWPYGQCVIVTEVCVVSYVQYSVCQDIFYVLLNPDTNTIIILIILIFCWSSHTTPEHPEMITNFRIEVNFIIHTCCKISWSRKVTYKTKDIINKIL